MVRFSKILLKTFYSDLNVDDEEELKNYLVFVKDRNFNDCRYFISSEKLEKLGWKPIKTDFKENIKELIEWYRENRSRYNY